MSFIIRPIEEKDAEDFCLLQYRVTEKEAYLLYEQKDVISAAEQRERIRTSLGKTTNVLVCLKDDILVGYLGYSFNVLRKRHTISFGIAVHPDFRRQGIAGALLDYLHKIAPSQGIKRIEITCAVENLKALRLYLLKGYIIEGTKKASLLSVNGMMDEYILARLC